MPETSPGKTGQVRTSAGTRMNREEIEEMFAGLGAVTTRRMFGGQGVYRQGLIVAVELRGGMMLKGDALTASSYEAGGGRRWVYEGRGGRPVEMPYWSVPDAAWDDPDEMARFVRLAYDAAMRAAAKPAPRRRASRTS